MRIRIEVILLLLVLAAFIIRFCACRYDPDPEGTQIISERLAGP